LRNYLLLIIIFFFSCSTEKNTPVTQNLSNWEFQYNNKWYSTEVPGNNFSDLLNNNIIPNPFYGTNEDSLQWVSEEDWVYKSEFTVSGNELEKESISLSFHGLDTYSEIYLNDSLILLTDNMFRKWEIDVKSILKKNNTLKVIFKSVNEIEKQKTRNLGHNLPGGNRVFSRKVAFHYGWDWGPKLQTSGIWRKVELSFWDDCKINDFKVTQNLITDTLATLTIGIEVESNSEKTINIQVNEKINKDEKIKRGTNKIEITLSIKNPELWWPNGYGNQKLYEIIVSIFDEDKLIETQTKKIGLRNIDLVTDKDSIGESFYFKVNGIPIFMKGSNYIPQDNLQNRVTKRDYLSLLTDVKNSNMNMIRVWGGGIYEEDIFYDLCDSLGILVWQDFMFACAMYPSDSSFLENVKEEAIYNVKRLQHHPSIALWCGNNENFEGWQRWGWQSNYSEKEKEDIWNGYQKLFNDILPNAVSENSQTDYWESSPKLGRGNPKHQFEGDAHYWGVWHDSEPFSKLETKVPRFMSEFGFQSYPTLSTISTFSNNYNINSSEILNHQKHPRGNALISEYMGREYNVPSSFEKYIYCSQILQAEGIRLGIEAHRRMKPICMGTLYWQLNDCWPGISWSSRDYFGNWKALQYAVQNAYSPLFLSISKTENGEINIYGVSDLQDEVNDTLEINIYNIKGELIDSHSKKIEIKENSSVLLSSEKYELNDDNFIIASLKNNKTESKSLFLTQIKNIDFPNPEITYKWEGNKLILESKFAAFQIYLHGIDTHFSDNYFTLLKNERKEIEVSGMEFDKNNLVIWSLYNLNK